MIISKQQQHQVQEPYLRASGEVKIDSLKEDAKEKPNISLIFHFAQ
jgi:hypothetical protein